MPVSTLPLAVAGAVLASAVLHASWNVLAKAIPHRLLASALIGVGFFLFGGAWTLIAPRPAAASWPYLAVSVVLQTGYLLLLTAAYARGEFRRVYPISRGTAPLLVTIFAITVLGERLDGWQLGGIALVVGALATLVSLPGKQPGFARPSDQQTGVRQPGVRQRGAPTGVGLAIATGVVIAAYSVVDGLGVRQSGSAAGYAAWQMLLHGPLLVAACLALAGPRRLAARVRSASRGIVALGIAGGVLSAIAYAIVLWAQGRASLSLVSALRETSVLFAGVIGALVFSERFSARQSIAAVAVVAGIVLMQLG